MPSNNRTFLRIVYHGIEKQLVGRRAFYLGVFASIKSPVPYLHQIESIQLATYDY